MRRTWGAGAGRPRSALRRGRRRSGAGSGRGAALGWHHGARGPAPGPARRAAPGGAEGAAELRVRSAAVSGVRGQEAARGLAPPCEREAVFQNGNLCLSQPARL